MSIINILPESISNKIAAGEVIERPASVVKELVENSIDAGATKISVCIEQAGIKLISVTDNGKGMDPDDALMCFEQHATSKIAQDRDIYAINTLGFRGEAIPSIASISRFTLRTRQPDAIEGTEVFVQGGRMIREQPSGCAPGTEIIIRDLFFNTPARKKFLRTASTEEKHIQECLIMLSLPYPNIAFELMTDGRRVFSSPGHENLLPRLQTYFGKEMASHMLPIDFSDKEIRVSGYAARHGFTRNSRREQRIFVNGRPVEALPVYNGIRDGYGSLVEKGRFPPVVIFLRLDPALVDVNVHPAKREVRFGKSRNISSAISAAIKIALRGSAAPTVSVDPSLSLKNVLDGSRIDYAPRDENLVFEFKPEHETPRREGFRPAVAPIYPPEEDIRHEEEAESENEAPGREYVRETQEVRIPAMPHRPDMLEASHLGALQILGFVDQTYILCAAENGLLIIDQHAAHERVLFEKLLNNSLEADSVPSQQLLLPLTLELSRSEASFAGKNAKQFETLGFDIEFIGNNTVLVSAIPASLHQNNAALLIKDMLSDLAENENINSELDLSVIARASCIAAVKAHDHLTFEEARSLLKQMAACELPFSCPHGRPTVINISYHELEKRFGRR